MKNLFPIYIIVAAVIIGGAVLYSGNQETGGSKALQGTVSAEEAASTALAYINKNILTGDSPATLGEVSEENGVYKFKLTVGGQDYDSFITKDAKLLFTSGINLEETPDVPQNGATTGGEAPKSDRPDVKLFVMSYCPFGLQAQKMYLPVYDLLKDKADMGVYFVNYIMHEKKEIDENLNQYCIQKEEPEKYSSYLSCFVIEDDYEGCASKAGINTAKIQNCVFDTDKEFNITSLYNNKDTWLNGRFPKFNVHDDLNVKYGVGGSPTVVINDQVVSVSPRTPEKFKQVVCGAFNSPPEECNQVLSNDSPSAGIGGGTGTSGGSCE